MLLELGVFLLELIVCIVYPLLMTLKFTIVSTPDYPEKFKAWAFYWIIFILLQNISWYTDFFILNVLKTVVLVLFALPQFMFASKGCNYALGPLRTLILHHFRNISQTFKEKLS